MLSRDELVILLFISGPLHHLWIANCEYLHKKNSNALQDDLWYSMWISISFGHQEDDSEKLWEDYGTIQVWMMKPCPPLFTNNVKS